MAEEIVGSIDFQDEIDFIEVDAEVILNNLVSRFEEYTKDTLFPSDERRMFLHGLAYVLADEANHINETGRGNLLKYAEGEELDGIGDLFNNKRLQAEYAKTNIKITLSVAPSQPLLIPMGTRVTNDGTLIFATDEDVTFLPTDGTQLSKEVGATAIAAGSKYNDLLPGQIKIMVDSKYNSYVSAVVNTIASAGGTDIESDADYKERLRISPFKFSVAGPSEAYRSIAMSVSNAIADVMVHSPSAGVVEIVVVKDGGIIPEEDDQIIEEITATCSARDVRPLTDNVRVVPATASYATIDVKYYIGNNDTSKIADITQAVEDYRLWQTEKIGRDINPDYLTKLMMEAGAARVVVTSPEYRELQDNEIAQFTDISVSYGGSINI